MEKDGKESVNKVIIEGRSLINAIFSWSIDDILNRKLYKDQLKTIPETFTSTMEYMVSFIPPLIEEIHADLLSSISEVSRAPTGQIYELKTTEHHKPPHRLFYNMSLRKAQDIENNAEYSYEPMYGDLIALTDVRPKCVDDLKRPTFSFLLGYVYKKVGDECKILSSKPIMFRNPTKKKGNEENKKEEETLFVVSLSNLITNIRIWNALHPDPKGGNLDIIDKLLQTTSDVVEDCTDCLSEEENNGEVLSNVCRNMITSFDLNRSQESAVMSCIRMHNCRHNKTVKLIWGPPGTGKTKTVSLMLFAMLELRCRTLTCTPTNTAVLEVASRVFKEVAKTLEYETYGLGDIVLFGNRTRMKIDEDHDYLLNVFLDHRVDVLCQCFAPFDGWKNSIVTMIKLLDDPFELFRRYLIMYRFNDKKKDDKQKRKTNGKSGLKKVISHAVEVNINKKKQQEENKNKKKQQVGNEENSKRNDDPLTFEEYVKKRFRHLSSRLQFCIVNMYTHLATSVLSLKVLKDMITAHDLLKHLQTLFERPSFREVEIRKFFAGQLDESVRKITLLEILNSLPQSFLPENELINKFFVKRFCLENACLIFCTVSSSSKICGIKPIELLIIDEAAQLKECESTIPLQLYGLRHAILIGDERQLPAMVISEISKKAEFGRSLFERLVSVGHKKHLLGVQYRMHPSISLFPNNEFYDGQIVDAANVKAPSYKKRFLTGDMYGPYSFINVGCGAEEFHNGHSTRNMVEVAVVNDIVSNLYKEYTKTKRKMSIGVISPYKAQTYAMEDVIGKKYSSNHAGSGFKVSIRSVDGFQGGEEDVIIMSTVRCNANGSVGFLSNHQRANVALTRARYCLWILGNEATLMNSNSIWTRLIVDAKKRGCFYNADDDISLSRAITTALVEIGRCDLLLNMNSLSFKGAKWKVCYSKDFWSSISRIKNQDTLKEMLSLLEKLSSGWRIKQKDSNIKFTCNGVSSQMLKMYPLDNHLNIIWTVDIIKENSDYIQVLKIWDVLPLTGVDRLARHLDKLYGSYTVDMISRCKDEHVMRNRVVPKSWRVNSFAAIQSNKYEDDSVLRLTDKITSLSIRHDERKASYSKRSNKKHLKPKLKRMEGDGMKDRK